MFVKNEPKEPLMSEMHPIGLDVKGRSLYAKLLLLISNNKVRVKVRVIFHGHPASKFERRF